MGVTPPDMTGSGPLRAEVFVIAMTGDEIELAGPEAAEPWVFDIDPAEHPSDVVAAVIRRRVGTPTLLHSTSWRHDGTALILSFVAVIDPALVDGMARRPIRRASVARADATSPPEQVDEEQVAEHALRHLAWLAHDDPAVAGRLSDAWRAVLAEYVPEPFRNLA